jgi:hypothetical protein
LLSDIKKPFLRIQSSTVYGYSCGSGVVRTKRYTHDDDLIIDKHLNPSTFGSCLQFNGSSVLHSCLPVDISLFCIRYTDVAVAVVRTDHRSGPRNSSSRSVRTHVTNITHCSFAMSPSAQ